MNRLWMTLFLIGGMIQGTVGFLNESFCQDQMLVSENPEAETVIISQKNNEVSLEPEKKPKLEEIAPEATPISGLLQFHQKKDQLFMELTSAHLNTDFIIIISIARGLGDSSLYGGMSWDFGEDMIWQFRKVNDRIQIVRRNFRYQAPPGTPESKAIQTAFTDSILYSLPIVATGPNGGDVIDLSSIFMSDLPMISSYALPGFSFARERSTWKSIKGLKENMELEISATYAGSRTAQIETVMDARGISIDVHYSISRLPNTGYQPRLADERVGYFNTVLKDFSKNDEENNFVRYINRWNLQKLEPNAQYSLPKKPIVFWLEKTIPYQYRKPIRDGILEWNKAFERAGFYNAIEVRQQEDNDEWDPEDINYNTIRWSTAGIGFAIGPSRVNPMTGEILDADVVLDVGFINSWNRTFELYSSDDLAKQFCGEASLTNMMFDSNQSDSFYRRHNEGINERLYMSQQMGFAETFFDVMACEDPKPEEPKP
ncbi:MAG: DUF5117 domain-containing protein, partial [Planctomycetia bacterium]|nr:DUF5117 domain-containing protein [Planctomycetia bacterium]